MFTHLQSFYMGCQCLVSHDLSVSYEFLNAKCCLMGTSGEIMFSLQTKIFSFYQNEAEDRISTEKKNCNDLKKFHIQRSFSNVGLVGNLMTI